jgi:hypothetical protein
MKPKYILLFVLLINMTGCVTIVRWRYGITNPKLQNPEKLMSFLKKHKYPYSSQYVFSDSSSYFQEFRDPLFRKNLFSTMIFDSMGSLIQRDTNKCQWSGYEVIEMLDPDSAYNKVDGSQLSRILDHIKPVNPVSVTENHNPDFTIVVTWAMFIGEMNDKLFELSEAAGRNKEARIRLIWLNIDMQENWNLTKAQKLEIK